MNKRVASWKQSLSKYFTWPFGLALFVVVYMVFVVFRFYEWDYTNFFMWNVFLPLMIVFTTLTLFHINQVWTPAFGFFLLYIAIIILMDAFNTGKSYHVLNERIIKTGFQGLACFSMALVLPQKSRKRVFHIFMRVYLTFFALIFLFGIYAMVSGTRYEAPTGAFLGALGSGLTGRLNLFMNPNSVGTIAGLILLLSLYMALAKKKIATRIYYILLAVIASTTLALSYSTTNMIAASVGIGLLAFVLIRSVMQGKPLWRWTLSLLGAVVACALCLQLFDAEIVVLQKISAGKPVLVNTAEASFVAAAQAEAPSITQNILSKKTLSGRIPLWSSAFTALKENPRILLFGASTATANELVFDHFPETITAMHNEFLTVLYAGGIFALLSLIGFLLCVGRKSLRLLLDTSDKTTLAMRFLPSVVLYCVINTMAESQFYLSSGGPRAWEPLLYIVAGYVCVFADRLPKRGLAS